MHPEDLKAALRKRGFTLTSVAASVRGRLGDGVTKGAVSRVIHGSLKSAAIARAIASALDQHVATLWPGKYPDLEKSEAIARARAQLAAQGVREPIRRPRAAPTATRSPK